MLEIVYQDKGWLCYCLSDQLNLSDHQSIDQLLASIKQLPETLKYDKRSIVKAGQLFGHYVVAKQPLDKNHRKWSRFLSLFRLSEVKKTALTLNRFKALGIPSVEPLLVLEKRRYGMVIDSWILYLYRQGEVSDKRQLADVVNMLANLHQHGFRHDDPNFGNFLLDEHGELFLIDCKGRPRVGAFTDYYDYLLLSQRNADVNSGDVESLVKFDKSSLGYRLAYLYAAYKASRTTLKRKIRNR